jgi:hypothetical protein
MNEIIIEIIPPTILLLNRTMLLEHIIGNLGITNLHLYILFLLDFNIFTDYWKPRYNDFLRVN